MHKVLIVLLFLSSYTTAFSQSPVSVNLGIKKNLRNEKTGLTFSATDIFNRFGIRQEVRNEGSTATYQNYFETQLFRLGFKYKI